MVAGEDRLPDPGRGAGCGAAGAQHRGGAADRVGGVVGAELAIVVAVDRVLGEGGGPDLSPGLPYRRATARA